MTTCIATGDAGEALAVPQTFHDLRRSTRTDRGPREGAVRRGGEDEVSGGSVASSPAECVGRLMDRPATHPIPSPPPPALNGEAKAISNPNTFEGANA